MRICSTEVAPTHGPTTTPSCRTLSLGHNLACHTCPPSSESCWFLCKQSCALGDRQETDRAVFNSDLTPVRPNSDMVGLGSSPLLLFLCKFWCAPLEQSQELLPQESTGDTTICEQETCENIMIEAPVSFDIRPPLFF